MSETSYEELKGPNALVAHRQINSDCGGAVVFCVVLADGFIVECGSDGYSEKRAKLLAGAVNAFGPDKFEMRKRAGAMTNVRSETDQRLIRSYEDRIVRMQGDLDSLRQNYNCPCDHPSQCNGSCTPKYEWTKIGARYDGESVQFYSERGVRKGEWQDINTAPKDGTIIDLWHQDYGRIVDTWWDGEDAFWVSAAPEPERLTHWMPLPAPPSPSKAKQVETATP